MPDPDSSPPSQAAKLSQEYPIGTLAATPSLETILRRKIVGNGPLSFVDFMNAALYEPGLGYYAKGSRQVGRGGDFFTSVSVGPLFGELLARRFLREWKELGKPARWRLIECGAHDGTLAADVLGSLRRLDEAAYRAVELVIAEPLASLREAQATTLAEFGENVRLVSEVRTLATEPLPGVVYGNELLDALPFHVVEWDGGRWRECRVGVADTFFWEICDIIDPALQSAVDKIRGDFSAGYRTEVRTNYAAFFQPLAAALVNGRMIWADYGFARAEYYHPLRAEGTLRTFSKHKAADDPLADPGTVDITAHVDFTAVAEAAESSGGHATLFRNQGAWLTENGREWLMELEGRPDATALRQFQTLTHPAQMGGRFHFIELSWGPGAMDSATAARLHG